MSKSVAVADEDSTTDTEPELDETMYEKKEGQISVCPLSYVRHRGKGKGNDYEDY